MSIGHKKPILKNRGRNRKSRAKSFPSQEKAKIWAETNKIEHYKIEAMNTPGQNKKYIIV